jgi:hypothetical protein
VITWIDGTAGGHTSLSVHPRLPEKKRISTGLLLSTASNTNAAQLLSGITMVCVVHIISTTSDGLFRRVFHKHLQQLSDYSGSQAAGMAKLQSQCLRMKEHFPCA